jgi:exosome complex component RRP42
MAPPQVISDGESGYIVQGFESDVRNDGRQREDYRRIELEVGQLVQTSGSARLKLGKTEVIVAVKVAHAACWLHA